MQALTYTSRLRWLMISAALGASDLAFSEPVELDITIELMQPGETPSGFINRIELPSAAALNEAARIEQEQVLDTATSDVGELTNEVQQTINSTVTDAISTGDMTKLPDAVSDLLTDDIAIDLPDEIIDELVDDLLDEPTDTSRLIDDLGKTGVSGGEFKVEGGEIDSDILEHNIGDDIAPELLEDLPQEMQGDEFDSLINELPLDTMEPIQDDDINLPDTDLINTL